MVNGEAHARPVKTGISDQERIEILEGVGPEDDVIVGPFRVLDEMVEGQPVKLEEVKKEAAKKETVSEQRAPDGGRSRKHAAHADEQAPEDAAPPPSEAPAKEQP